MQTRMQTTMGMQVPFSVPSTIEEFGAACGVGESRAPDVVLKYALDEGMFRTVLPNFREAFFARLEEESGVERAQTGTTTKKDGDTTVEVPVYEKDSQYWKRVLSETEKEPSDFEEMAAEVSAEIEFDLRSKPRSGKPAKEFLTRAQGLRDAVEAGKGTWDAVIGKLKSLNPWLSIETDESGAPDEESLARALKVDADRRKQEQTADLI